MSDNLQKTKVISYVRFFGAALMLGGVAFGFNLGGIATAIGLADGFIEKVMGGTMFFAGIVDFYVLPVFLAKKLGNDKPDNGNP